MSRSLIVDLGAHGDAPAFRDAVGTAGLGLDQTLLPQAVEDGQIAVGQHHSIATNAGDGDDFGAIAPFMKNAAAEGQHVQNTLLGT